jgi:hypothetical protein
MSADGSIPIPPHFMGQLEAISHVSGKPLQACLNAVLAAALPDPDENPANLLRLSCALVQPGDCLDSLLERFRYVRDADKLPIDDHAITVAFEKFRGLMDAEEAALLDHANALITGAVEPVKMPSKEELDRMIDQIFPGDEWKQS